jgi:hypothetical protein
MIDRCPETKEQMDPRRYQFPDGTNYIRKARSRGFSSQQRRTHQEQLGPGLCAGQCAIRNRAKAFIAGGGVRRHHRGEKSPSSSRCRWQHVAPSGVRQARRDLPEEGQAHSAVRQTARKAQVQLEAHGRERRWTGKKSGRQAESLTATAICGRTPPDRPGPRLPGRNSQRAGRVFWPRSSTLLC